MSTGLDRLDGDAGALEVLGDPFGGAGRGGVGLQGGEGQGSGP